jgi:hypothetical protein
MNKVFRVEGRFARLKQNFQEMHGLGPSRRTARRGRSTAPTTYPLQCPSLHDHTQTSL